MNRKYLLIGLLGILFIIGAALYLFSGLTRTCTEIGCGNQLTITGLDIQDPTYIEIDGVVLQNDCENVNRVQWQDDSIELYPEQIGHDSGQETIEELVIGTGLECGDDPEHRYTDLTIDYDTYRPNGPGCPPTCRQATVSVE